MSAQNDATNYDAQRIVEEITKGEKSSPQIDIEKDYERSKQYSTASHTPETIRADDLDVGDPDAFRKMARDVSKQKK